MNVKEFKELVASIPDAYDEYVVIQSKDMEGNGFYESSGIDYRMYGSLSEQWYDPYCDDLCDFNNDEDEDADFNEFIEMVKTYEQLKPCIVIF